MSVEALGAPKGKIIRDGKAIEEGLIVHYGKAEVLLRENGEFVFPNPKLDILQQIKY